MDGGEFPGFVVCTFMDTLGFVENRRILAWVGARVNLGADRQVVVVVVTCR
jgi:hypothetical protein